MVHVEREAGKIFEEMEERFYPTLEDIERGGRD